MAHNRKLVIGGVSLTTARLHRSIHQVGADLRDEVEAVLINSGYFDGAPFTWVGLILRYGLTNDAAPRYDRIDVKDGELPLTIEVDTRELQGATVEQLRLRLAIGTLTALIHAGERYSLATAELESMLAALQVNTDGPVP